MFRADTIFPLGISNLRWLHPVDLKVTVFQTNTNQRHPAQMLSNALSVRHLLLARLLPNRLPTATAMGVALPAQPQEQ